MKVTLSLLTLSCLAIFLTGSAAAHADTFTFTSGGRSLGYGNGSGTLTAVTDPTLPNVLDVTSASGTIDGQTIIGLLPCATYDPSNPCSSSGNRVLYDNLLYPGGTGVFGLTVLDFRGIGLDVGNGLDVSFYAANSHQYGYITNSPHDNGHLVGFSITPIPEPGSFVLLGTGLLGVAGAVRRRVQ